MSLPDVDATSVDLNVLCDGFFIGEFTDMNELISEMTEITDWQRQLDQFAEAQGLTGLVRLDEDAIREQSQMNGEIVDMGGRLYVFHE